MFYRNLQFADDISHELASTPHAVYRMPCGPTGHLACQRWPALVVLYPACRWFRDFKRARPNYWVRFI